MISSASAEPVTPIGPLLDSVSCAALANDEIRSLSTFDGGGPASAPVQCR
jgi:hypothetical protein